MNRLVYNRSTLNAQRTNYVHSPLITQAKEYISREQPHDQAHHFQSLFLGYLVLSIHAHGLGSCLFQFLQANKNQDKIRREFGISDSEVISAFV